METILAIAIIGGAIVFAWYYLNRSEERRASDRERRAAEDAAAEASASGLAIGDRPLCPTDGPADCLAKQILRSDISVNNWDHVDRRFRDAYWANITKGIAAAIEAGMSAACWRAGSREQVYNELRNKNLISESERNEKIRRAQATALPGYGAGC